MSADAAALCRAIVERGAANQQGRNPMEAAISQLGSDAVHSARSTLRSGSTLRDFVVVVC